MAWKLADGPARANEKISMIWQCKYCISNLFTSQLQHPSFFFFRALKIKMRNKVWLICKHFPGLFQALRWDGKN